MQKTKEERRRDSALQPKCGCGNHARLNSSMCGRCEDAAREASLDEDFLYDLSDRLGVSIADLQRLIEIARR